MSASLALRLSSVLATLWFTAVVSAADPAGLDPKPVPAKKDLSGTWTWQTVGPNGQPDTSTLEVFAGKSGWEAKLTDRTGAHPVATLDFAGGELAFTVNRNTPNGDIPIQYSIRFGADKDQISIERPDPHPHARMAGKKRRTVMEAVRGPAKNSTDN